MFDNKHLVLDNGMSSNDACASVSTSRAKRRIYCIIVIFLILLISLVLTLGAVILIAVRSELELNKPKDVSNEQDARLMSEIDSLKNQLAHFVTEVQSNISQLHGQIDPTTDKVTIRTNWRWNLALYSLSQHE